MKEIIFSREDLDACIDRYAIISRNLRILDLEKARCMREISRFPTGPRGKRLHIFLDGIKNEANLAESIATYERAKINYLTSILEKDAIEEDLDDAVKLNNDLDEILPDLYKSYEEQIASNKALVSEINAIRLQALRERLERELMVIEDDKSYIDQKLKLEKSFSDLRLQEEILFQKEKEAEDLKKH